MRNKFPEYYYQVAGADFTRIWHEGIFVFDANVLLDLFRYSSIASDSLLSTLEKLNQRIWLPYQATLEYLKHSPYVIIEQVRSYTETSKEIKTYINKLLDTFKNERRHPFLDESLYIRLESVFHEVITDLGKKSEELSSLLKTNPIKERLADLFDGKVGEGFSPDELNKIYKEGELRYKEKIPPGYIDAKSKQGNAIYGDLIIWKEMLKKTSGVDAALIFVTNDTKEDWFLRVDEKAIGPRPELIAEIRKVKDILFHIYPTRRFLEHAKEHIAATVTKEVIQEVQDHVDQARKARDAQMLHIPQFDAYWKNLQQLASAGVVSGIPLQTDITSLMSPDSAINSISLGVKCGKCGKSSPTYTTVLNYRMCPKCKRNLCGICWPLLSDLEYCPYCSIGRYSYPREISNWQA